MIDALSKALTTVVFAIRHLLEGKPEAHEIRTMDVDCLIHGKTTLQRSRQTACCGSLVWVPSGNVTSRALCGRKGRRRPGKRTRRVPALENDYIDAVPLGLIRLNEHVEESKWRKRV